MKRMLLGSIALAGTLAVTGSAAPSPTKVRLTLQPGQNIALTMERVPRGQFAFALRASSDGVKHFVLTQQRVGRTRFKVLDASSSACEGAAGTLYCTNVTTPAPAARAAYVFRVRNLGDGPLSVTLRVTWTKVTSAG